MNQESPGTLYIVATPIGNRDDISVRAIKTLETVDWIACEDTRHSRKLLQHLGIQKPLFSLHDHNEVQRVDTIESKLMAGESGALISDAGTPLISDPGYVLVSNLRERGMSVSPVPGASALITALSAAGMRTDRFGFEGFLPAKKSQKKTMLETLVCETRTVVMYESTHRLIDTLALIMEVFGPHRKMCVAKELTKSHERFVKGTVQEVVELFAHHSDWKKGEFVLIVEAADVIKKRDADFSEEQLKWLKSLMQQNIPVKQIAEIGAQAIGVKKKIVYEWGIRNKKD